MNDLIQVDFADLGSRVISLGMFASRGQEKENSQLLFDSFTVYLLASNSINFYVLLVHCV